MMFCLINHFVYILYLTPHFFSSEIEIESKINIQDTLNYPKGGVIL